MASAEPSEPAEMAQAEPAEPPIAAEIEPPQQVADISEPSTSPAVQSESEPGLLPENADQWIELHARLPLSGMLKSICGQLAFRSKQGDSLIFDIDPAASGVLSEKYQEKFQQVLATHLGLQCSVRIETGEQQSESPAARAARERREALQAAEQEILQSPLAQVLQSEFSARLVPGSVELVSTTEGQEE